MNKSDYILEHFKSNLILAKSVNNTVYINEYNRLLNLRSVRDKFDKRIRIQEIFTKYWPSFKSKHINSLRPSVVSNVESMIGCKDLDNGYIAYSCSKCDNFTFTAFSCNSRFCPTCGKKYRDARSIEIQAKLINVSHRHFVFTIAEELRVYFFKYRKMLNLLFEAVNLALNNTTKFTKKEMKHNTKLGFISFLHTYGRDLKANPHIHVLIAEAKVDSFGNTKKNHYFHFEKLRTYFMYCLLNLMKDYLNTFVPHELKNFRKLSYQLTTKYKKGFYVYGPANKNSFRNIADIANYIARYGSHPAISESRIVSIDHTNKTITWKYDPHEDDGLSKNDKDFQGTQFITDDVDEFIIKLIRHIPDKGFHLIRYYGFYANKSKTIPKTPKLLWISRIRMLKSNLRFTVLMKNTFKFDPYRCKCGGKLVFDYEMSYFPMKGCVF